MKTLLLILLLTIPTFPCGLPQPIYGTAPYMSVVKVETKGEVMFQRPNIFRRFSFIVSPCRSYIVTAQTRFLLFEPVVVHPIDFEGKGVRVDF